MNVLISSLQVVLAHHPSGILSPASIGGACKLRRKLRTEELRSTDTATRIRRYGDGDMGYGDFKKQRNGDMASICINAKI
jgi:hypothetical protein